MNGILTYTPEALGPLARTPEVLGPLARTPEALGPLTHTPEALGPLARTPEALGPLTHTPEALGPPICRYYVHIMETFANPDVWIARGSALGTMVSHTLERSANSTTPDFLYEDRQLLRDIRDSPTRVTTIRLQWVAGSQRPFEYSWATPYTVDPGASYDALVITVSPDKVAQATYLGHISQWRNSAKFTYNYMAPHLRAGWLKYIHQCVIMWSTAPLRPLVAAQ
jgi:hypothetical protein